MSGYMIDVVFKKVAQATFLFFLKKQSQKLEPGEKVTFKKWYNINIAN